MDSINLNFQNVGSGGGNSSQQQQQQQQSNGDGGEQQQSAWLPTAHRIIQSAGPQVEQLTAAAQRRIQPIGVFCNSAKFRCPSSPALLVPRVAKNVDTFLTNYLIIFAILMLFCIITSFWILIVLILYVGVMYWARRRVQASQPFVFGGKELPPTVVYGVVSLVFMFLFAWAGTGSVFFWVLAITLLVVLVHASCYANEEVPGEDFDVVVA